MRFAPRRSWVRVRRPGSWMTRQWRACGRHSNGPAKRARYANNCWKLLLCVVEQRSVFVTTIVVPGELASSPLLRWSFVLLTLLTAALLTGAVYGSALRGGLARRDA